MEPQIRYARAPDGVDIAWYAVGSGPPFLWPASPQGAGIVEHWRVPEFREVLERIARTATLVVWEPRGFGLSRGTNIDYSCDAYAGDIEAVAEAAAPGRPFVLQAFSYQCIPVLTYAARHPERISALLLLNGIARGADLSESWPRFVRLASEDWNYAKVLLVRMNEAAFTSTETLQQMQHIIDRGVSQAAFLAFAEALKHWDASGMLDRVVMPTLVTHYGDQTTHIPPDASHRLAAALPNASFAAVEGGAAGEGRLNSAERATRQFLRGVLPAPDHVERQTELRGSGTAVILFTDIADSTPLTEQMGDTAFHAASRALDGQLRAAIAAAGGTVVDGKVLGDGVMGIFTSASEAIDGARACLLASQAAGLPLHLGVHAGDVIREPDNVYGGAVNIASRICGLCAPGEILVSSTVRDLARTSAGVRFEDRGEQALKGVAEPVRVFAVVV